MQCLALKHPNDHHFRFCQMCGDKRRVHYPVTLTLKDVALPGLDTRLDELQMLSLSTAYANLNSKTFYISYLAINPFILLRRWIFVVFLFGKTQFHIRLRPHLGKKDIHPCKCPLSLSYELETVANVPFSAQSVGKVIGIPPLVCVTLTAASFSVKEYLKSVCYCGAITNQSYSQTSYSSVY